MSTYEITDHEFDQFRNFIYNAAGINMQPNKKALICGRLAKRLRQCSVVSYDDYFRLLISGDAPEEAQTAVDLLTTNETYFFRESKHFDWLRDHASAARKSVQPFRAWSAACSSGEEAYSMAMVLEDCLGAGRWEMIGSDISMRVLQQARAAHYSEERARLIPHPYLQRFCLKGLGNQQGTMLIDRSLRNRVQFMQVNLNAQLPQLGMFDAIFLRNVMIYFAADTKRQVVSRILSRLRPGGLLCISHSESLHGLTGEVQTLAPSVYRKG